jgi:exosome complex component CSL4
LPGERIGVIEEFVPDTGTFVKEGAIYSSVVGRTLLDFMNRRVSVYSLVQRAKAPEVGNVVLGQVSRVRKRNAYVRIHTINEDQLAGFFTGLLYISDVRPRYVDSMFDVCKPGDTIRAKVVSKKNGIYHLSTKGENLGVVYAFCSACGHTLDLKRKQMHCPRCGRIERRKTASDYKKESSHKGDNK